MNLWASLYFEEFKTVVKRKLGFEICQSIYANVNFLFKQLTRKNLRKKKNQRQRQRQKVIFPFIIFILDFFFNFESSLFEYNLNVYNHSPFQLQKMV